MFILGKTFQQTRLILPQRFHCPVQTVQELHPTFAFCNDRDNDKTMRLVGLTIGER